MRRLRNALIAAVLILLVSAVGALAVFLVTQIKGEVTVEEAITVAPTTFTVPLKPNESYGQVITVSNSASAIIEVRLGNLLVMPPNGLQVQIQNDKLNVPAYGSIQTTILIVADSDVSPGNYTITVDVSR